jgi:hypothetical protein
MQRVTASPSGLTRASPHSGQWVGIVTVWPCPGADRPAPHHFGNNFPRLAHNHRIAQVNIQFRHAIGIVQRGPRHRRARQLHRTQLRHRGYRPRAPHLKTHLLQHRGHLFCRILQRHRPAGKLLGKAQLLLQIEGIQLHHHPIGHVGQLLARSRRPIVVELLYILHRLAELAVGVDLKAKALEGSRACHWVEGASGGSR